MLGEQLQQALNDYSRLATRHHQVCWELTSLKAMPQQPSVGMLPLGPSRPATRFPLVCSRGAQNPATCVPNNSAEDLFVEKDDDWISESEFNDSPACPLPRADSPFNYVPDSDEEVDLLLYMVPDY